MRQRKVRNLEEKMSGYRRYLIDVTCNKRSDIFGNENDLYLEMGSGKGNFLLRQAKEYPDRNYIGIEGQASVVFRALEKLEESGLSNVRFLCRFINYPGKVFPEGEITGVYLNFSDPWPKKYQAHRRLTHRNYLAAYHKLLKKGGAIEFKTDNDDLFNFTVAEVTGIGLYEISEITKDLHNSGLEAANITTEYEDKFMEAGVSIKYIKLVKMR